MKIEAENTLKKPRRFLWSVGALILFVIIASVTYAWYSLQRSCEVNAVEEASARLVRQRDSYDHSYQFATSASRDAVVRPVAELQQILIGTQEVAVPVCLQTAKDELISYMGTVIRAFQAYGAQEPDATVRGLLDQSNTHYNNFHTELDVVNKCAPLCLR